MPQISSFFGIVIMMFANDHNPPHFHARYQGNKGEFTFDGEMINGNLPKKQVKFIQVWAAIHKEDLETCWELLQDEGQFFSIEPLR